MHIQYKHTLSIVTPQPPVWVNQTIVGYDMALEVGNPMVLLFVAAPDDRAEEMDPLVDLHGAMVTLQVAGGIGTLVGCERLRAREEGLD
jgi:hypothetical protein